MAQSREMTSGPSLPLILNFTFPLLLGNLLQQLYNTADSIIVGNFLGSNALAAVGSSGSPNLPAHRFQSGRGRRRRRRREPVSRRKR